MLGRKTTQACLLFISLKTCNLQAMIFFILFSVDFTTCFSQLYDMRLNIKNFEQSRKLLEAGLSVTQIEHELKVQGLADDELLAHLKHIKGLVYLKQRGIGFKCITVGALLCIAGCFLTFMHDYSSMYAAFTLYGLTIAGTCLVIGGLAYVLGI